MSVLEISANAVNAVSIVLAGRNSVHTWWTGIVGCFLFGVLFVQAKLYADATLQVFFIVTSVVGLSRWRARGETGAEWPVARAARGTLWLSVALGALVTASYALVLHLFTDAFAPLPDSFVLAFSAVAQLLLTRRLVESWWFWLLVNTVSVPLFMSRELYLTAALYALFWLNAVVSLRRWQNQVHIA